MTCRVDTSSLFAGACVVSLYAGHGVLGSAVPSTGTHGPSPVYNDLSLPADANKEYRWRITVPPASGTFTPFENGSYSFAPTGDGTYTFTYLLTEDGADLAPVVGTITVGAADTTLPTLTGTISITGLTSTGYIATWPAGSDNVAVTSYERSLDGGSTWVDVGNVTTLNVTGRTPSTTDPVRVRAKDAAGNVSTPALSTSVNLLPLASVTTDPVKDYSGAVLANTNIPRLTFVRISDGASVLTLTNQVTNGGGVLSVANAALAAGVAYLVIPYSSDGTSRGAKAYTAA